MNSLEVILVLDIILNTQSQFSSNLIENVIFFFGNKCGDTIEERVQEKVQERVQEKVQDRVQKKVKTRSMNK